MRALTHAAAAYLRQQPRLRDGLARLDHHLARLDAQLHPAPPVAPAARATRRRLLASLVNHSLKSS